MKATASGVDLAARVEDAKAQLDAHVREIIEWHFSPETGCPFWLEFASKLPWSPRREISCFGDLRKFPPFRDEWLRGGPVDAVRRLELDGRDGDPSRRDEPGAAAAFSSALIALEFEHNTTRLLLVHQ